MPDNAGGECDHALGHAAMREEVARQYEERNRHDFESLDAREQLQRHGLDRHAGEQEQECQHGQSERNRNRHAGEHQCNQQREHDADLAGEADRQQQRRDSDQPHSCPWFRHRHPDTGRSRRHAHFAPPGSAIESKV
jgi:hypothetical protein